MQSFGATFTNLFRLPHQKKMAKTFRKLYNSRLCTYKHKHKSQLINRISSRNLATKPQTRTNEIIKSLVQNTSTKFSKKKGTYEYLGYCCLH
jgi:hypothetical protein